jgi:hypothetical protein
MNANANAQQTPAPPAADITGTVAQHMPNFMSDDPDSQLFGTRSIRQLLSRGEL